MIYFTGDMHGDGDRISRSALRNISEGDTLIVCGDFGFIWDNSHQEHRLLEKLSKRNIRVLFIDGTHENFSLLDALPVTDYCGGKVHRITDNIYHLLRGQIYEIEGKTVFAFGGGENPDLELQNDEEIDENRPEVPTKEEMLEGIANLEAAGYKVDYIVTHEPPAGIRDFLTLSENRAVPVSAIGAYLDELAQQAEYRRWFFGSLHMDKFISTSSICVFENIIEAETGRSV